MDLGRCSMATTWVWVSGFVVVYDGKLIWVCMGLLGLG